MANRVKGKGHPLGHQFQPRLLQDYCVILAQSLTLPEPTPLPLNREDMSLRFVRQPFLILYISVEMLSPSQAENLDPFIPQSVCSSLSRNQMSGI